MRKCREGRKLWPLRTLCLGESLKDVEVPSLNITRTKKACYFDLLDLSTVRRAMTCHLSTLSPQCWLLHSSQMNCIGHLLAYSRRDQFTKRRHHSGHTFPSGWGSWWVCSCDVLWDLSWNECQNEKSATKILWKVIMTSIQMKKIWINYG